MSNITRKIKELVTSKPSWAATPEGLQSRRYESYEQYLDHQRSKLAKIKSISKKSLALKSGLRERLPQIAAVLPGASALCLGARSGAECEAFIEQGVFAVGVDLNPGEKNKNVLLGDFHALQFADRSVDIVYTNSLDHSFDLGRVIGEVSRVLKFDGTFIAEIVLGADDAGGKPPGDFEASWWRSAEDVVAGIAKAGLVMEKRSEFSVPWRGIQAIFTKPAGHHTA